MIKYTNKLQVVPLLRNVADVSTDAAAGSKTAHVRLRNMQWLSFLINWDHIADSTSGFTVTAWSSTHQTTTAAGDTALPFKYRVSSAIGTDAWGAITAVTTGATGATVTGSSTDNRLMLVDVDPAVIPALDGNALYAYLRIVNISDESTNVENMTVVGIFEPRYPQNANLTSS